MMTTITMISLCSSQRFKDTKYLLSIKTTLIKSFITYKITSKTLHIYTHTLADSHFPGGPE